MKHFIKDILCSWAEFYLVALSHKTTWEPSEERVVLPLQRVTVYSIGILYRKLLYKLCQVADELFG